MQLFDLHRSKAADLAQIIAPQIHQHIMLGQFLFIGQQVTLQRRILRLGLAARPGTGQWEGMQHAVLQLDKGFGRGTCHLDIGAGKIEHVGRWIDGAQHPIGPEQAALKRCRQPVGQNDLKNIALINMMARLFDHGAVGSLVKQRRHLAQQTTGAFPAFLTAAQKLCHPRKLQQRLIVVRFQVIQCHIGNQDDLLAAVVKGNDLVKEHQIDILEGFRIHCRRAGLRLTVAEIIVGEVTHKAAGKGRQPRQTRAFIPCQYLAQHRRGVFGLHRHIPRAQRTVHAGDLQLWVIAQKGIPAPFFIGLCRLQQIAMGRDIF